VSQFVASFLTLPKTAVSAAELALRQEASTDITQGLSPETQVAIRGAANAAQNSLNLAAVGLYVTDLTLKAEEGFNDAMTRFAQNVPFSKMSSASPGFDELEAQNQLTSGVNLSNVPSLPRVVVTGRVMKAAQRESGAGEDRSHIVTLTDAEGYTVEFVVMPEIVENRSVQYDAVAPAQFPGAFQKYKGTDSVQWTINATLISRTTAEATQNLEYLNRLRGWTMPFFGENTKTYFPEKLGAPPPVLKFKGLRKGIIGEVPTVITSLQWNWPKDVDYIPADDITDTGDAGIAANIPFPTVIQIAISLVESYSTKQFNQFNLVHYRTGDMVKAFSQELSQSRYNAPAAGEVPTPEPAQAIQRATVRVGTEQGRATSAGVVAATVRVGTERGRATNTAISERKTTRESNVGKNKSLTIFGGTTPMPNIPR
jgi:hypothetical protein